jgi:hypothetical protein
MEFSYRMHVPEHSKKHTTTKYAVGSIITAETSQNNSQED